MPLVTSENREEVDRKEMEKRSGKKPKKGKLDKEMLRKLYRQNAEENSHTENSLLLAEHFGTPREQEMVKKAIAYRDKMGGYASDDEEANKHYASQNEIHKKYWGHLHDEDEPKKEYNKY